MGFPDGNLFRGMAPICSKLEVSLLRKGEETPFLCPDRTELYGIGPNRTEPNRTGPGWAGLGWAGRMLSCGLVGRAVGTALLLRAPPCLRRASAVPPLCPRCVPAVSPPCPRRVPAVLPPCSRCVPAVPPPGAPRLLRCPALPAGRMRRGGTLRVKLHAERGE